MKKETKNRIIILVLYVDNILVLSDNKGDNHWLINKLEKEYETLSVDMKDSPTYLGMVPKWR